MVIINAKGGSNGLFTYNGHYVVLVGIKGTEFIIYDPDLYVGKYETSQRKSRARLSGKDLYVSFKNVKTESNQYFCFYAQKETKPVITSKAKYVRVNSSLNIRSGSGTNNSIIGSLKNNTLVTVFEEKNGFSRIGNGKWVSSEYLKDSPSTEIKNQVMTVIPKIGLNVRANASTNAKIITAYPQGTKVTIYEIKNGWAKGIKGWMSAKYLK